MTKTRVVYLTEERRGSFEYRMKEKINSELKILGNLGCEIVDIKLASTPETKEDYGAVDALIIYRVKE